MRKMGKLRYRLTLIVMLLMSSTLFVVTAITHNKSLSVIREQAVTLNESLVEAGVEILDSSHSQLNNLFQSIYLNEDFENFLRTNSSRGNTSFQDAATLNYAFLSALSSRSDLYSIIFIDMDGRVFYATRNETGFYAHYSQCYLPSIYIEQLDDIESQNLDIRMIPTHLHIPLRNRWSQIPYVYTAARKIINIQNQFEPVGIMFITATLSDMERIANLVRPDESAITYIADSSGQIIFASAGNYEGGVLPAPLTEKLGKEGVQDVVKINQKPYIMVSAKASEMDWYVITTIPEAEYKADAFAVSTNIVATAILALFIAFWVVTALSYAISKPIEELAEVMSRSQLQDLTQRIEVRGKDEIAQLEKSFNDLMDKLELSIHNEYVMSLQQKDATIRALQAQLNPHFLYNALQSMGSIALVNNVPEINEMAIALGNNLRYAIKSEDLFATVREEISHVNNYLFVQKIRFGKRLNYIVDIPECIMEYMLPRVSLQPMVENAIIHGFENREEPGNISIQGWMEDDQIIIEVSDDGQGISEEHLKSIRANLEENIVTSSSVSRQGIGISNLNARLKLLYEHQGSLTIDSIPEIGTVVKIVVKATRG